MSKVTVTFSSQAVSSLGMDSLTRICIDHGAKVHRVLKDVNACVCEADDVCIKELKKSSEVVEVYEHIDNEVHMLQLDPPYPYKGDYAGKEVNYGVYLAGCIDKAGNEVAWKVVLGHDVNVYVVDTGGDIGHADLFYRKPMCYNAFTDFAGTVPPDGNGHGTHCAGIIAATGSTRFRGIAPAVNLGAVKVLSDQGFGTYAEIVEGLEFILNNADRGIVNMSLGSSREPPIALKTIINKLVEKGFLVVAAAGNDGGMTGYPARYENVISVSALDRRLNIAQWSSRGKVEFAGAGVTIWSTDKGNSYSFKSGTSMACPQVVGSLALICQAKKDQTYQECLAWAKTKAIDVGDSGKDTLYGYGVCYAGFVAGDKPLPPPPDEEPQAVTKVFIDNLLLKVDEIKGDTAIIRKQKVAEK